MRNLAKKFTIGLKSQRNLNKRNISSLFQPGKDATAEKPVSVDIGPMVPGRKRSKPIKNDPEEKSAFLFPRWETKYVDSIDVLGLSFSFEVL